MRAGFSQLFQTDGRIVRESGTDIGNPVGLLQPLCVGKIVEQLLYILLARQDIRKNVFMAGQDILDERGQFIILDGGGWRNE